VPGTGFASRPRVDRAAEVAVLTAGRPLGRRSLPDSGAVPGSQETGRRAECSEPRSGVLDGSEQHRYQGDRVRPGPDEAARSDGDARSGRVASSVVSAGQASQVTRSRGRNPENLTTSMPREPDFEGFRPVLTSARSSVGPVRPMTTKVNPDRDSLALALSFGLPRPETRGAGGRGR
jgi:hypothetical protein